MRYEETESGRPVRTREFHWRRALTLSILAIIFGVSSCIASKIKEQSALSQDAPEQDKSLVGNLTPGAAQPDTGDMTTVLAPMEALSILIHNNIRYICMKINTPDWGYSEYFNPGLPEAVSAIDIIRQIGDRGIAHPPYLLVQGSAVYEKPALTDNPPPPEGEPRFDSSANNTRICELDNPNNLP